MLPSTPNHSAQMSTPKTAPDFGEPWIELTTWDYLQTEAGKTVLHNASDMNEPYRSRAISCVNACAGMSDPAADIQALRDAVKKTETALMAVVKDGTSSFETIKLVNSALQSLA